MILVNKAFVKVLSRKGYILEKKKETTFLPITDYSEAIYCRGNFYFEIESQIACNFNQFFFHPDGWHYHTKTVEEIALNHDIQYKGSTLDKYYSLYKPNTFSDLYFTIKEPEGLTLEDQEILEEDLNKYKYDLWSSQRQKVEMGKIHEYGLLRSHGTQHFGPVTQVKGELELNRLKDTYRSINENGYCPKKYGYMTGYFLKYNNQYRFIILDGNHRAAVLCAMKYEKIPVTFQEGFPRVIDYNDIENFPHVKNGLFSIGLAKQIFKSYFEDNGVEKATKLGLT